MSPAAFIVAIDGPAASGKGTISRRLAAHFDFAYLDTGSLYRAVARDALNAGGADLEEDSAIIAARNLDLNSLDSADLRTPEIGEAASVVAAMPGVRDALIGAQRHFARQPPGGKAGAVLDGRDIGTVICPDAPVKLFVTANIEVRARRRLRDHQDSARPLSEADVRRDLDIRDARDASRDQAPLKPAEDAHLLDTSEMSIEAAVAAAILIAERKLEAWRSSYDLE